MIAATAMNGLAARVRLLQVLIAGS